MLITGVVGTPLHELSHAITATAFGMKVKKVAFYRPDPASKTLGFVSYSYNPLSTIHRFGRVAVGIAPLFAGAYAVYGLFLLVELPTLHSYTPSILWSDGIPLERVGSWSVALFGAVNGWAPASALAACVMIGAHSTPSLADMTAAGKGWFGVVVLVGLVAAGFYTFPAYVPLVLDLVGGGLAHFSLALIQLCLLSAGTSLALALLAIGLRRLGLAVKSVWPRRKETHYREVDDAL